MKEKVDQRNQQLAKSIRQLPIDQPYDNIRPINIPGRLDGQTLIQCMVALHPQVSKTQWDEWFRLGHIVRGDQPVPPEIIVRGGNQFQHRFPGWVEPTVDVGIQVLWEDQSILAVNKPAPLPVHPSGRFNRNTMIRLMATVYQANDLRVVHRLDSNTTGVILLARTKQAATSLRRQFESNRIGKTYLVRTVGCPSHAGFRCDRPISRRCVSGGLRTIDPQGDDALTEFEVRHRHGDGTCSLVAQPRTGRTNQIRIHLWALGIPILGDPAYLADQKLAPTQTRSIQDPPMCLHASRIDFRHPLTDQPTTIDAADPDWWVD